MTFIFGLISGVVLVLACIFLSPTPTCPKCSRQGEFEHQVFWCPKDGDFNVE